jgi:hypothetical protein
MKPVFKEFVEPETITTPKSGWKPIEQKTVIENFNQDKKYSFKTLKEVLGYNVSAPVVSESKPLTVVEDKVKQPLEQLEVVEEKVEEIVEKTLVDKASEYITKRAKIEEADSFQQPVAPNIPNNLTDINKRVRYLEQWLAKVSMDGPGSGEVRLKFLDDVDRATIAEGRHLAYNATTDTFFFEDLANGEPQVQSDWAQTNSAQISFIKNKPILANVAITGDYNDLINILVDDGYTTNINTNIVSVVNVPNNDIGPIDSLRYNTTGFGSNATVGPGLTYYDPDRDTLEVLHKDGSATYVGLDNYIRVSNNGSGNLIPRGSLIQFVGVESANLVPYVDLFTANADAQSLYVIGLAATDLVSNAAGRAILLGEIEDIDTTGTSVGEVWQTGDILWANPSIPGGLTKFRPTAPNAVVSVAAVLNADPTDGHLLVRPTIEISKNYGRFARTTDLTTASINTAAPVTFNKTTISNGVFLTNSNAAITVSESGYYQISVSAQLDTNSNKGLAYLWLRKNGVNVDETTRREAIESSDDARVFAYVNDITLNSGDNVQIMFAVTNTDVRFQAAAATAFAPATASFIVSVTQVQL